MSWPAVAGDRRSRTKLADGTGLILLARPSTRRLQSVPGIRQSGRPWRIGNCLPDRRPGCIHVRNVQGAFCPFRRPQANGASGRYGHRTTQSLARSASGMRLKISANWLIWHKPVQASGHVKCPELRAGASDRPGRRVHRRLCRRRTPREVDSALPAPGRAGMPPCAGPIAVMPAGREKSRGPAGRAGRATGSRMAGGPQRAEMRPPWKSGASHFWKHVKGGQAAVHGGRRTTRTAAGPDAAEAERPARAGYGRDIGQPASGSRRKGAERGFARCAMGRNVSPLAHCPASTAHRAAGAPPQAAAA